MRKSIAKRRSQGIVAVSTLHALWRQKALERDDAKCAICGDTNKINVHHLVTAKYKNLRYDLNNAVCLCSDHHKFSYTNSPHSNPIRFFNSPVIKKLPQIKYIEEYDYSQEFDEDWNRVYEELKLQK